jgi:hypothetical protein
VRSDESYWLLDKEADCDGNSALVLFIMKKTPATDRKQFWNCFIQGDEEIYVPGATPNVHEIPAGDREAMRAAIDKVSHLNHCNNNCCNVPVLTCDRLKHSSKQPIASDRSD